MWKCLRIGKRNFSFSFESCKKEWLGGVIFAFCLVSLTLNMSYKWCCTCICLFLFGLFQTFATWIVCLASFRFKVLIYFLVMGLKMLLTYYFYHLRIMAASRGVSNGQTSFNSDSESDDEFGQFLSLMSLIKYARIFLQPCRTSRLIRNEYVIEILYDLMTGVMIHF